ncbi:hypothetical protein HmCmsJML099_04040 [Escherichia coli]|nr:hypothetical protein HmCmsJML099_04040 [Escherichia coli]
MKYRKWFKRLIFIVNFNFPQPSYGIPCGLIRRDIKPLLYTIKFIFDCRGNPLQKIQKRASFTKIIGYQCKVFGMINEFI